MSESTVSLRIKRAVDLVISSAGLLLFPVILIPVAIGIRISSPGPVFYRQLRTGQRGDLFTCYKFRTMYPGTGSETVYRNDPRVTTIGRFLRRTSLDELPQLLNVFLGQMSLVGPRPHMITHTLFYGSLIEGYAERLTVKPGITGLAQVNGYRGATDRLWKMQRRVENDIWYINNRSLRLDLRIMARTLLLLVRGDSHAF